MKCLVTGAGGFIGTHLVEKLKAQGHWVRGADVRRPRWSFSPADEFHIVDLRHRTYAKQACLGMDWVFHLAANMGGMGFITRHEAEIMRDNTALDLNMIWSAEQMGVERFFYPSSVCVYPAHLLVHTRMDPLSEDDVYPALPQLTYGWTKLHGEHLCRIHQEAGWLNTRIARFHNTYGPKSCYEGERAKAPAQLSAKVALAKAAGESEIEIWGDGQQTRPFMFVSDCVDGILAIMESEYSEPFNLGPDRIISIDGFVDLIFEIAGVRLNKKHVAGPQGARGRAFDHSRIRNLLGWEPQVSLELGIAATYVWVEEQVI